MNHRPACRVPALPAQSVRGEGSEGAVEAPAADRAPALPAQSFPGEAAAGAEAPADE
jgi:hypothetical protein